MEEQPSMSAENRADKGAPVVLTDQAIAMVKAAMRRELRGSDEALRIGVVGGGCSGFSYSMSFDAEIKPDDTLIEADGIKIVIDAAALEYLDGTVLDYVTGLHGSGFKFENPKAQRTCGCGSSFSA